MSALTRREFLAGAASMAALKSRPRVRTPYPPPKHRAPVLIGYGVVNLWHTIDPTKLAGLLYSAGCTLTEIEYVAWFNQAARKGESVETHVEIARRFVEAMRKRRITTLISLVNWNASALRQQSDDWFRARLKEIIQHIGTEGVVLMGVSEPDSREEGKAYRWMRYALEEWKGLKAANGDGGRGDPKVGGFDYVDWHHCGDFNEKTVRLTTAGKPTINNTDCGPVINPGPDRARAMARAALSRKAHFHIYGYKDSAIDEKVISTLGEEIQRFSA